MVEASISPIRAALGANVERYEVQFKKIAAAGRRWVPGWNSAAFLHSTAWFFYRRMYGLAVLNLLAPWALLVALTTVGGWIVPRGNLDTAALPGFAAHLCIRFILAPLIADSRSHMR